MDGWKQGRGDIIRKPSVQRRQLIVIAFLKKTSFKESCLFKFNPHLVFSCVAIMANAHTL